MKKLLLVPMFAALMSGAGVVSAQSLPGQPASGTQPSGTQPSGGITLLGGSDVSINPDQGRLSGFLNTDVSWQVIQLPLRSLNGAALSSLTLSTTGLPSGLSISLARATQVGNTLVLNVDVNRSNTNAVPNGLANVTLAAGGNVVAMFQVPVQYVAYLSR
ncbi:hypothetical protein [Deinococcus altitudinis]|uniref:hypothetical protein n=1 Tax=Deinococcus altitudinis TaxID=468914 RepID=UPI00389257FE